MPGPSTRRWRWLVVLAAIAGLGVSARLAVSPPPASPSPGGGASAGEPERDRAAVPAWSRRRDRVDRAWPAVGAGGAHDRDATVLVDGVVRDLFGNPLGGVEITAARAEGPPTPPTATTSADDGRFALMVPPGPVALTASLADHAAALREIAAPARGLELVLVPAVELRGRVIAAGGGPPIGGAVVVARGRPVAGLSAPPIAHARARTDAGGRFTLHGLAAGTYRLEATADGWWGESADDIEVAPGVAEVIVEATAGVRVAGRVIDDGGEACSPAAVALIGPVVRAGVDDGRGAVELPAVPAGDYQVRVSCGRRTRELPALSVGRAPVDGLVWSLSGGARLAGTVRDAAQAPVIGALVAIEPVHGDREDPAERDGADVHSAAGGRFDVAGLEPGVYRAVVYTDDRRERGTPVEVRLAAGDVREVALTVDAAGGLRGTVEVAAPRPGWAVLALGPGGVAQARVEPDGVFELRDLSAGGYRLVICDPIAGELGAAGPVIVEAGRVASARVAAAVADLAIAGAVVDATGAPVDDALVSAHAVIDDASPCTAVLGDGAPVATDERGGFVVPVAAAGEYRLRAVRVDGTAGTTHAGSRETARIELSARRGP